MHILTLIKDHPTIRFNKLIEISKLIEGGAAIQLVIFPHFTFVEV